MNRIASEMNGHIYAYYVLLHRPADGGDSVVLGEEVSLNDKRRECKEGGRESLGSF